MRLKIIFLKCLNLKKNKFATKFVGMLILQKKNTTALSSTRKDFEADKLILEETLKIIKDIVQNGF